MAARAPKSAPGSNVHVVVGNDDGAVKEAARARAEKLAPVSLDDLSTEIIDGAVDHADTAAERVYSTIGALQTLLLDKNNYLGMVGGDGACLGCGEKTVVHLFTGTVEALMQPRVARQVEKIDGLIANLDRHIRLKLAGTLDLSDAGRVDEALAALRNTDVTLASFSEKLDARHSGATIDPDSAGLLDRLIETALRCPTASIEIAGHTDTDGDDGFNQALSEKRAQAVADYLVKAGLPADRFKAMGYGSLQPVASNDTDEGKAQNRRIEFVVR